MGDVSGYLVLEVNWMDRRITLSRAEEVSPHTPDRRALKLRVYERDVESLYVGDDRIDPQTTK